MKSEDLEIFQGELKKQCEFALKAVEDLKQALKANDASRIWSSIHAFLGAAGNISKLFWPPDKEHRSERGAALRKSLSVGEDSPLRNRDPRNYLEHFDEYLDEWVASTKSGKYVDISYGCLDKIKEGDPDVELKDFLRYFDCKTFSVILSGDSYSLQPLIDAIQELRAKVESKLMKGSK